MKRKDYIRDPHSNALLKRDKNELLIYRARKNELHSLREEIDELKRMVLELRKNNK
jgi:polyhydroxyalkanoate synthesis regulator phasin